jgi:hypothetical protein
MKTRYTWIRQDNLPNLSKQPQVAYLRDSSVYLCVTVS